MLDEHVDFRLVQQSSLWIVGVDGEKPTQLVNRGGLVYDDLWPSTDARFVMVRASA